MCTDLLDHYRVMTSEGADGEREIDQYLLNKGSSVEPNPQENVDGAGRQGDRYVNGLLTEYKTISGVQDQSSDGLSAAIASRAMDARGQAPHAHIIIDVRNQSGITREAAERGISRAYGADEAEKIQEIRIIGNEFDIIVPRE